MFLPLFLSLAGCAIQNLLNIVVNGFQLFVLFLSGVIFVVKLVLIFDKLLDFLLKCLIARKFLQTLGIKISFGCIQDNEVTVMCFTVGSTGFIALAGFQSRTNILGLVVVQNMALQWLHLYHDI